MATEFAQVRQACALLRDQGQQTKPSVFTDWKKLKQKGKKKKKKKRQDKKKVQVETKVRDKFQSYCT